MKRVLFVIFTIFVLNGCSSSIKQEDSVLINQKPIKEIIETSINKDNDNPLVGAWEFIEPNTGMMSFYNDKTHLLFSNLENVGINITAGTYEVIAEDKLTISQNVWPIGKNEQSMKEIVTEYSFELDDNLLKITTKDSEIPIVLKKIVEQ